MPQDASASSGLPKLRHISWHDSYSRQGRELALSKLSGSRVVPLVLFKDDVAELIA
jgi:hypothetical protein